MLKSKVNKPLQTKQVHKICETGSCHGILKHRIHYGNRQLRFSFILDVQTSKINELLIYIIKTRILFEINLVTLCNFYCFKLFIKLSLKIN